MKTLLISLIGLSLTGFATAEFETWTNKEGKSVKLSLVKVTQADGQDQGDFKMLNGRTVTLKATDLSDSDASRLAAWKPAETPSVTTASVFDSQLNGNLVVLKDKDLVPLGDFVKPTKYYLFYYTASWCGPCQKFTPSLVEFYNANKPANNEFEVVLISSDNNEESMTGYAVSKKMPWPQLKLAKIAGFRKEFNHPGTGIPNLVLTDTEGKLLKTSYVDGKYMGPASVMNYLGTLLKK